MSEPKTNKPFGTKFIEELKDEKIPPSSTWSWKPEVDSVDKVIKGSTPGTTGTRNFTDERRDEM